MLCSKCREKVLPVVAVDIDGTLAEYHESVAKFVSRYFGIWIPTEPWDGSGEHEEYLGITKAQWREMKLAYRQGGFKRFAPIYPGALEFMQWLEMKPVEVWLTTTRPWQRLDNIDPDTRWWLSQHGIKYDALMYDENKYFRLAERAGKDRVILILDDLPELLAEAAQIFPDDVPFLVERPHNEHFRRYTEDDVGFLHGGWNMAQTFIEDKVDEWRAQHA